MLSFFIVLGTEYIACVGLPTFVFQWQKRWWYDAVYLNPTYTLRNFKSPIHIHYLYQYMNTSP